MGQICTMLDVYYVKCQMCTKCNRGGSRFLKRGGTAGPVIIVDIGLAGIFTLIVCEAHKYAKHASTRGSIGIPPREILKNYTF